MHNVVVTGASRGLGLTIASRLASLGYGVIAIARNETVEFHARRAAVGDSPGRLEFRRADLSEIKDIAAMVRRLRDEFGPIYGLINNAGLGTSGILAMMRDDAIENLVRLNTVAPLVLSKYVLRSMISERAGRIINISSVVASTGYSGLAAYSATKAALLGFTRSLAREVGPLGITVNAIAPGFAETDMTREIDGSTRERLIRRTALRRLISSGDIADSVEFLLSEKARNITGTTLTVDAGSTA